MDAAWTRPFPASGERASGARPPTPVATPAPSRSDAHEDWDEHGDWDRDDDDHHGHDGRRWGR